MDYYLYNKNDGISEDQQQELSNVYENQMPLSYLEFLKYTNGYLFEQSSVILYSSEEIEERNNTFEVCKYLSEYIAIGDYDGDKLVIMKKNRNANKVYIADSCSISMNDFQFDKEYDDLRQFIEFCMEDSENIDDVDDELYDVIINSPVKEKKIILKIKQILKYTGSISELLNGCQNPPFTVIKNIDYISARIMLEKDSEISKLCILKKSI